MIEGLPSVVLCAQRESVQEAFIMYSFPIVDWLIDWLISWLID